MTYKRAIADGKTSLGQAKNIDEMHTVVGNTAIQGTMSIIFVVCALIVMIVACIRTVQALRGRNIIDTEDPAKPSKIFAPSGLMPTKAERICRLSGTPSTRSTLSLSWKVSTRTRSTRDRRTPTSTNRPIVATMLVVSEMVGTRRHRRRRLRQLS